MWKWSLLALGLGLLFAVLAWSGLRRRGGWRDGEKLWGQVAGVSVTPAWNGADSMDGDRSPARVTLRLSLEGRGGLPAKGLPQSAGRPRPGPAGEGAVPPLHRGVGAVEGHPLLVGAVGDPGGNRYGGVPPAVVRRKNRGGAALRLHRRPPQPGGQRGWPCSWALGPGQRGAALTWGAVPACPAGTLSVPLAWVARSLLGQWEPRQARFVGWVQESDGDGGVRSYPLFSLGQGRDFFPGRHKAEAFRTGGHSHRLQEPQGPVLPGAGTSRLPAPSLTAAAGFLCGGCSSSAFW